MATAKKKMDASATPTKGEAHGHEKSGKKSQKKGWPTWAWYALGGAGALGILAFLWVRQSAATAASTTATEASPVLVAGTTGASTEASANGGNEAAALDQQNAILAQLLALGQTDSVPAQSTITPTSSTPATTATPATPSTPPPSTTPVKSTSPAMAQSIGKVVSYKESVAKPGLIRVTAMSAKGTNRTYLQRARSVFSLTHVNAAVEAKAIGVSTSEARHLQSLAKGAESGNSKDANRLRSLGFKGAR
jgi:hypothetical protein